MSTSSALSFRATVTLIPTAGGPASSLGSGSVSIAQNPTSGSTVISSADWNLELPADTRFQKVGNSAYLIYLPPTAKLSSIKATSAPYVLPEGSANLKIEFSPTERDAIAVFETLFLEQSAQPSPALPQRSPPVEDHRNSLALVNEQGQVVGVVAEGLEIEPDSSGAPPPYRDENESVVIELSSLPKVDLGSGTQDEDQVQLRVKALHDASSGIATTSQFISTGLILGSSALGKVMKNGANGLKTLLPVASKPWVPSESTKRQIENAHKASKQTADLTRKAAETVASVAVTAGKVVASKAATIVPSTGRGNSETASASWDFVKNTIHAVSNIMDAGVQAGKTIYEDSVEATSNLVQHRYGSEAGDAVRLSLGTVGNVGLVYFDAKGIGRRAFLKQAAKGAVMNVKLVDGRVVSLGSTAADPRRVMGTTVGGGTSVVGSSGPSATGQIPLLSTNVHPQTKSSK